MTAAGQAGSAKHARLCVCTRPERASVGAAGHWQLRSRALPRAARASVQARLRAQALFGTLTSRNRFPCSPASWTSCPSGQSAGGRVFGAWTWARVRCLGGRTRASPAPRRRRWPSSRTGEASARALAPPRQTWLLCGPPLLCGCMATLCFVAPLRPLRLAPAASHLAQRRVILRVGAVIVDDSRRRRGCGPGRVSAQRRRRPR